MQEQNQQPSQTTLMIRNQVVLPALLVLAIVLISLTFAWLASPGGDVESLLEKLAEPGRARWPAALALAAMLNEPGHEAMKEDAQLAARLSEILRREIEAAASDEDSIRLRIYLCRTLGEFHLADVLPALLDAAESNSQQPADVRRAAIEAVAVLASNVSVEALCADERFMPCLLDAAEDDNWQLRCAAAFALGVVGCDDALSRLEAMLADDYPEIRYNAATGLARHGNLACLDVLVEMLDAKPPVSDRGFPPAMVQINALRSIAKLAEAKPAVELKRVEPAVERLSGDDVEAAVRAKAVEVLRQLRGQYSALSEPPG